MGGDAMYYGLNALSNNMILLDRKQSRCPNGLVFGTPGSGKSMSCKREITFIMLMTQDNVIICDPEDEYSPLVKRLGGQVIRLSPSSTDYVNPLDINLNYSEEENPLALKSDFVLSFCELIMGSKTGLEAIEKTVIDRAVQMIYQPYFADPRPENMPILGDLMNALLSQHIPEADRVAQALDLYVNGSLNFFNHRTTVDISNRLVSVPVEPENPLRTAEMTLEDDYGMIDGIVNNGRRGEELEKAQTEARRTTPEKKPSIRERLEDAKRKSPDKPAPQKKPPELGDL